MRAAVAALALTGLVALTGVLVPAPATSQQPDTAATRPPGARNVVIVLTDDMRADELRALPHVRRLIGDHGVTFDNAYAVDPVCCPSRVSILTGQYPHNSGVVDNVFPHGGFAAFDDSSSLGTWLDDVGYRTGFIGKYLNQYGKTARRYVPPGWDVWKATVRGVYAYREPAIYNVNGDLQPPARLPDRHRDLAGDDLHPGQRRPPDVPARELRRPARGDRQRPPRPPAGAGAAARARLRRRAAAGGRPGLRRARRVRQAARGAAPADDRRSSSRAPSCSPRTGSSLCWPSTRASRRSCGRCAPRAFSTTPRSCSPPTTG